MKIMFSALAVGLALAAAPSLAQPSEAALTCVYDTASHADIRLVIAANTRGGTMSEEESAADRRYRDRAADCGARHGEATLQASVEYGVGQVAYESAGPSLRAYGIDPSVLERAAAQMDERAREDFLAQNTAQGLTIVGGLIEAQGVDLEGLGEDRIYQLGVVIGHGLGGLFMRDRAAAQFRAAAGR